MECPNCKLECPEGAFKCDCGYLFTQDTGETRRCPYCAEVIQAAAVKCRFCGEMLTQGRVGSHGRPDANRRLLQVGVLAILLLILASLVRIYYGGGVGLRIVRKDSPSFSDTIVNLDEIFGMPRIVVASKHPAVKRQMEQMGWIKTDEEVAEEARQKFQQEFEKNMREAQRKTEEEMRRLRRQSEH